MNAGLESLRDLGVDIPTSHNTPERRLNMSARAAKPVVKIEMAERGVEIVPPQQVDHAATKPNTFRVAGRPRKVLRRLGNFVDFTLIFACIGGLLRLRTLAIATLGHSRPRH